MDERYSITLLIGHNGGRLRKTLGVNSETRVNLDFVFFQSDFSASSFLELRSSTLRLILNSEKKLVFMILLESGERRLAYPSDPLLKD
jgi:hypothetical protein